MQRAFKVQSRTLPFAAKQIAQVARLKSNQHGIRHPLPQHTST